MKTLKCNKCNKIINNAHDNWDRNEKCINCGGYFSEVQAKNNSCLEISNVTENIPHIHLGKEGFSTSKQPKPPKTQKSPNLNTQKQGFRGSDYDKGYETYEKIRTYIFWAIVLSVMAYAGWRIISGIWGV